MEDIWSAKIQQLSKRNPTTLTFWATKYAISDPEYITYGNKLEPQK